MLGSRKVKLCLYCHPQSLLEVTHELGVTIWEGYEDGQLS